MYDSHSIPVSVEFQHNQILFNEEKYKKHILMQ